MLLHDMVGYWLTYAQRCHALTLEIILREHCEALGKAYIINPPQWSVLSLLSTSQEPTIGSLAQHMGVDAPTITHTVRRLEEYGLVERVHDHEDRRVVKVRLSAEGQDLFGSLGLVGEAFHERLLGTAEERQALIEQLQHLIADLSKIVPGGGDRFGLLPMFWREYHHDEQEANVSTPEE
jgi:MarR family transcriptional regulator, transcriptional regulator for hemolysin